ncbi:uncharacterized protein DSM5745_11002 [Aspergillus mulundensis]|uniref:Uncharacterized protein n=1 Tax=Aspergillus mulundensis TaxID=1810919 RepID=A0A3D8QC75_9EURO|nr:hypothetical protein DSM5745_11002 [Aspergillus mulundensis]RDW59307.1 hypothetical protein DSM5745_11002 [Aspergillus mulundensis]
MSTTTTSTAPSSTCTGPAMYELPIKDAACGVPNKTSYKSPFERCAYPAAVQAYHSDCALYAPALDQSVQDLIDCLYGADVAWEDVWCTGGTNSTATGTYETATVSPTAKETAKETSTKDADGAEETGSGSGSGDDDDDTNGAVASKGPGLVVWGLCGLLLTGVFGGLV